MNEFKIGERINNNDNKYKFTNDQQKAIDGIIDFIASPFNPAKYIVGLIGAGGTGKTFITKYIIIRSSIIIYIFYIIPIFQHSSSL